MVTIGRRSFIKVPGGNLRRIRTKVGGPMAEFGHREPKRRPHDSRRAPEVIEEFPQAATASLLGLEVDPKTAGQPLVFASFEGTGQDFHGIIIPKNTKPIVVDGKQLLAVA